MTQYVICALQMEGFHCWPEADGELAYLKNSHRHIFFITAEFPVRNANREIEIISQQNAIKRYLLSKYGDEDGACHFGRRSCEDIAAEILNQFENSTSCTVLEDGFGGCASCSITTSKCILPGATAEKYSTPLCWQHKPNTGCFPVTSTFSSAARMMISGSRRTM